LAALREFSEAQARVIRNNTVVKVPVEDVVVGDHAVGEEGSLLAADGVIVQSNDFSVNESILTGEAFAVARSAEDPELANVSKGTQVVSGLAVYRVTAVGKGTQLGKISTSLAEIEVPPTPLQQQITRFVRNMAIVGVLVFFAVWAVAYTRSGSLLDSLLTGLTLAMSILPEEIPVAFATFLALGAWRLAKQGVIVKRSTTVETLGSATVICTDKTGTITENRMSLAQLFVQANGRTLARRGMVRRSAPRDRSGHVGQRAGALRPHGSGTARSVQEDHGTRPPSGVHHGARISARRQTADDDARVRNGSGERIIACKGAPERVLRQSDLSEAQKTSVLRKWKRWPIKACVCSVLPKLFSPEQFIRRTKRSSPSTSLGSSPSTIHRRPTSPASSSSSTRRASK
jgi:Ca2+-transporting ATPase